MAQWGEARSFVRENGRICIVVIPHVQTNGFDRINAQSKIDALAITRLGASSIVDVGFVTTDTEASMEFFHGLERKFVGKPYADWQLRQ